MIITYIYTGVLELYIGLFIPFLASYFLSPVSCVCVRNIYTDLYQTYSNTDDISLGVDVGGYTLSIQAVETP